LGIYYPWVRVDFLLSCTLFLYFLPSECIKYHEEIARRRSHPLEFSFLLLLAAFGLVGMLSYFFLLIGWRIFQEYSFTILLAAMLFVWAFYAFRGAKKGPLPRARVKERKSLDGKVLFFIVLLALLIAGISTPVYELSVALVGKFAFPLIMFACSALVVGLSTKVLRTIFFQRF